MAPLPPLPPPFGRRPRLWDQRVQHELTNHRIGRGWREVVSTGEHDHHVEFGEYGD